MAADNYQARLVKFIPGEALVGFLAIWGGISAIPNRPQIVEWIVVAVLAVAAGILAWNTTVLGGAKSKALKVTLAVTAFLVWVFGIGGPFVRLDWYHAGYGSALVTLYAILAPALVK